MAAASAADTAAPASNQSTMASMVGGLILVLLLIFALAFVVKRFNLVPSSHGQLKTLAVTPLGQKEKLVLVEVGKQQYLLGVTPHQVNLIDKLEEPLEVKVVSFAEQLRQAKGGQK
ncbi:flagellar biosynthetic protein FliO [Shewanella sp. GXUN23E]|uniref:flagellar biosynthetic protein FliO n=1 Tax=Shewanella sp. GXUN23E TaxID=3422498 RepID=UPI003D7EB5F1